MSETLLVSFNICICGFNACDLEEHLCAQAATNLDVFSSCLIMMNIADGWE